MELTEITSEEEEDKRDPFASDTDSFKSDKDMDDHVGNDDNQLLSGLAAGNSE